MKKTAALALIAAATAVFLTSAVFPGPPKSPRLTKLTKSGGTYYVIAPPGAGPEKPCALLVAIHGDGYDAKTFQRDWYSYTSKAGYILALPEKFDHTKSGWSARDVKCIYEMLDEVIKTYAVPARLTVVAGHSSGVTPALEIAFEKQEVVSALINIAGSVSPDAGELKSARKFGVFIMHGSDDTIAPVSKARTLAEVFKDEGYEVRFREVPGHQHSTPFPKDAVTDAFRFLGTWFKTKARLIEKPGAEDLLPWGDTEDALEELEKGEKPGLVYIYAEEDASNPLAQFLEWDLFKSEDFKKTAGDFILIRVDRENEKDVAKKFKAKEKAALVFVDKKLKKLKEYTKPPSPKKLAADIGKILKKYSKEKKKKKK